MQFTVRSMRSVILITIIFILFFQLAKTKLTLEIIDAQQDYNAYLTNLKQLLGRILYTTHIKHCFAIITDKFHYTLYEGDFFQTLQQFLPFYLLKVGEATDFWPPNNQTKAILQQIKAYDCDLHVLTLLNGLQIKRFIQHIHDSRALNIQQKFVMLYDSRLFQADMLPIWSTMLSTIFLKRLLNNEFSITTVAYPGILSGYLVMEQLTKWTPGKRINSKIIFTDKTKNLKGAELAVAIVEHVPMVQWNATKGIFEGVEIEILQTIAFSLNFKPIFNKANVTNDSLNGLVAELSNHTAHLAVGDLHLFQTYLEYIDLSWPHYYECLTFLTPESSEDNTWKTLVQPFSGDMWAGVLLSLFLVGTIFYVISFLNALLMRQEDANATAGFFSLLRKRAPQQTFDPKIFRNVHFRSYLSRYRIKPLIAPDLFDNYANCILLTYSMLLYVALPRMPRNWPLRVLTGWYWIYCILLTVTYRASFTAILANPATKVTIDTVNQLASSNLQPLAMGNETKQFFMAAADELAQKLGDNMQLIANAEQAVERIINQNSAYYDNEYFLRYLRVQNREQNYNSESLHIMSDCVINMPIVLGLEKHSPLKMYIDKHVQHLNEAGLVQKWLKDAMMHTPAEEQMPQEALINLNKFWSSFIALAIGYVLGICALLSEKLHFKYVVMKHPLYNVYKPSLYYNFKRRYPNS